jgi:type II secretory pathway component PulF
MPLMTAAYTSSCRRSAWCRFPSSRRLRKKPVWRRVFSPEYVSIVISGETGGDLVQALANMAVWMERELEMKTAIKSALRYPVMVIIALIAAAVLMIMFVVPRFAVFFEKYTAVLPLPTRILIAVGEKTGSLDDMLDQIVDFYDMEIKYTLKNLTTMIEPMIITRTRNCRPLLIWDCI